MDEQPFPALERARRSDDKLERAYRILIARHPERNKHSRQERIALRIHGFLNGMRRLGATYEEIAEGFGGFIPAEVLKEKAEHIPPSRFYDALTDDEKEWLERFLLEDKPVSRIT